MRLDFADDHWPPGVWRAIAAAATRKAIELPRTLTPQTFERQLRYRPGHWYTFRVAVGRAGYELPYPTLDAKQRAELKRRRAGAGLPIMPQEDPWPKPV